MTIVNKTRVAFGITAIAVAPSRRVPGATARSLAAPTMAPPIWYVPRMLDCYLPTSKETTSGRCTTGGRTADRNGVMLTGPNR